MNYYYWVVSVNAAGESPFSDPAVGVRLQPRPTITAQPQDTGAEPGGDADFSVTATTNNGTLTYQWYLGESGDISTPVGDGSSGYTLTDVTSPGSVWVRIYDDFRSVDSATAYVSLLVPPPSFVRASKGWSPSEITVRWLAVPESNGYAIYRNTIDSGRRGSASGDNARPEFCRFNRAGRAGLLLLCSARSTRKVLRELRAVVERTRATSEAWQQDRWMATLLPIRGAVDFVYDEDSVRIFVSGEDGWVDRYSVGGRVVDQSVWAGPDLGRIDLYRKGRRVIVAQSASMGAEGAVHRIEFQEGGTPEVATLASSADGRRKRNFRSCLR